MVWLHANHLRDPRVRNGRVCFTALQGPGTSFLTIAATFFWFGSDQRGPSRRTPPDILAALHTSSHRLRNIRLSVGSGTSFPWTRVRAPGASPCPAANSPSDYGPGVAFLFLHFETERLATIFPGVSSTPNSCQIRGAC